MQHRANRQPSLETAPPGAAANGAPDRKALRNRRPAAARRRRGERGLILFEWALVLPLLLIALVGLVDVAEMIVLHTQINSLTREVGNLASRGLTLDETWLTVTEQAAPLDLDADGQMIVSVIRRSTIDDPTPIVQLQRTFGGRSWITSRVGIPGGPATVPIGCTANCIGSLPNGIVMVAVETAYTFRPVIPPPAFASMVFQDFVEEVAYF